MKRLLAILTVLILCVPVWGANRLTTWSDGQVLTHTALNAEFDNIYIANISRTAGYWGQNDNIPVDFGSSQDAQLEWDTVQTQDSLWLGLSGSMTFIITDKADAATDYAIAASTDPMLVVHSADATTATDYIAFSHNQTDAVVNAGGGGISIQAATTEITSISSVGDWVFKGTTPTLTVGDAGTEDAAIVYDGNAVDFYVGLDDGTDDLYIGEGATIGSAPRVVIDSGTNGVNLYGPITSDGTFTTYSTTTLGNAATDSIVMTGSIAGTSALLFEGSSVDTIETIFSITNPTTSDKTVTFQNATGTVALIGFGTQAGTMDVGTLDAATAVTTAALTATGTTTLNTIAYTWPASDAGGVGYSLVSDSAGTLSWADVVAGAATNLDDLGDVTITAAANLEILQNNGSGQWVDVSLATAGIAVLGANTFTADQEINGTTPTLTIGDAGEEDTSIIFDGNETDFYVALDDSENNLVLGEGSTIGSSVRIELDSSSNTLHFAGTVYAEGNFSTQASTTIGNAATDTITMTGSIQGTNALIFEGTTVDDFETIFAITDPTTPDKTVTFQDATGTVALIGFGTQTGTMDLTTIDAATSILLGGTNINTGATLNNVAYLDQANIFTADQEINGTTPALTIGDNGAEDSNIFFDNSATDYYLAVDHSGGSLVMGSGLTVGVTPLIQLTTATTEVTFPANTQIGNSVTVDVVEIVAAIKNENALWFDGATDDTIETIFAITDPTTIDKTITFPDQTGAVILSTDSIGDLTDVALSGVADHDALFFDNASSDWKNTAAVKIIDTGEVAISGANNIWFRTTATDTDGESGMVLVNDVQTWIVKVDSADKFAIKDETGTTPRLSIDTSGAFIFNTNTITINGQTYTWPADDGDAGEQLTSNGSGTLTWEAP